MSHYSRYLSDMVGDQYPNLPVVSVPLGTSCYLDKVGERHFGFFNSVIKGVDSLGRPFVSFHAVCTADGEICDQGIFTVFKRYEDDFTSFYFCRSHPFYGREIERVLSVELMRIGQVGFSKLRKLFSRGVYSSGTKQVRLTRAPWCAIFADWCGASLQWWTHMHTSM